MDRHSASRHCDTIFASSSLRITCARYVANATTTNSDIIELIKRFTGGLPSAKTPTAVI